MDFLFHADGEQGYLECLPGSGRVEGEPDALDLVAACGEHGTFNLLLPADCLSDEFFRLGSGLAGAVLLKFSLYRIRCAVVLSSEQSSRGRFGDLVVEANRRDNALHFFQEVEPAVHWLLEA